MTTEAQPVPEPVLLAQQNERLRTLVAELIRKNEDLRQRLASTAAESPKPQGWA